MDFPYFWFAAENSASLLVLSESKLWIEGQYGNPRIFLKFHFYVKSKHSTNINFTENISGRKILKFPHCGYGSLFFEEIKWSRKGYHLTLKLNVHNVTSAKRRYYSACNKSSKEGVREGGSKFSKNNLLQWRKMIIIPLTPKCFRAIFHLISQKILYYNY